MKEVVAVVEMTQDNGIGSLTAWRKVYIIPVVDGDSFLKIIGNADPVRTFFS